MKKFQMVTTTMINGFGVAVMRGDKILNHFDNFKEKDADNITNFINSVIDYYKEFVENDVPRVVKIADGNFYVTLSATTAEGTEIFFSSRAFKHGDTAARCGAICFLVLQSLKDKEKILKNKKTA